MLKFKEYITEQEDLNLEVDNSIVLQVVDEVNVALDLVTARPFVNSAVFMNAVRGTLERYGIVLPPSVVMPMLSTEAETVYSLGDSGMYLYIVHDQDEGGVDGYAQIVNEDELEDLQSMNDDELDEGDDDEAEDEAAQRQWIPPDRRKAADDGGNNDEY